MAVHDGAGESRLSGNDKLAGGGVEQRAAIAGIHRLREQLVAQSEIQRQPRADSPVVLEIRAGIDVAQARPVGQFGPGELRRISHQEIRQRRARIRDRSKTS